MKRAAALLAVLVLAVGCGSVPTGGPTRASGSSGDIAVSGAYVSDTGAAGYRPVYLTLHNTGPAADQLEAVIAPRATSTTWAVARHVHTPAEVAAFAETCGADPRVLAMSVAALAKAADILVPAGGTTWLTPGIARLQLGGIGPLEPGETVPMTLYFASGAEVSLAVPVSAGRTDDPLSVT